jgi:hypothetical protein
MINLSYIEKIILHAQAILKLYCREEQMFFNVYFIDEQLAMSFKY